MKALLFIFLMTWSFFIEAKTKMQVRRCEGHTDFRSYTNCLCEEPECTESPCNQQGPCTDSCGTTPLQCPPRTYATSGQCLPLSRNGDACPQNYVYSNGGCQLFIKPIQCPNTHRNVDGVCVSRPCNNCQTSCQAPCSPRPVTCGPSTELKDGVCVSRIKCSKDSILVNNTCEPRYRTCPGGTSYVHGSCVPITHPPCSRGEKRINGICTQLPCPSGKHNISGSCSTCPGNSIFKNGNCIACPPALILSGDKCICPDDKIIVNNTCVEFPNIIEPETDHLTSIEPNVITPVIETIETVIINDTYSPLIKIGKYLNIYNVTDIAIKPFNDSFLSGDNNDDDENAECCLIIEPMKCEKVDDKYKCFKRRHHACGNACKHGHFQNENDYVVEDEQSEERGLIKNIETPIEQEEDSNEQEELNVTTASPDDEDSDTPLDLDIRFQHLEDTPHGSSSSITQNARPQINSQQTPPYTLYDYETLKRISLPTSNQQIQFLNPTSHQQTYILQPPQTTYHQPAMETVNSNAYQSSIIHSPQTITYRQQPVINSAQFISNPQSVISHGQLSYQGQAIINSPQAITLQQPASYQPFTSTYQQSNMYQLQPSQQQQIHVNQQQINPSSYQPTYQLQPSQQQQLSVNQQHINPSSYQPAYQLQPSQQQHVFMNQQHNNPSTYQPVHQLQPSQEQRQFSLYQQQPFTNHQQPMTYQHQQPVMQSSFRYSQPPINQELTSTYHQYPTTQSQNIVQLTGSQFNPEYGMANQRPMVGSLVHQQEPAVPSQFISQQSSGYLPQPSSQQGFVQWPQTQQGQERFHLLPHQQNIGQSSSHVTMQQPQYLNM